MYFIYLFNKQKARSNRRGVCIMSSNNNATVNLMDGLKQQMKKRHQGEPALDVKSDLKSDTSDPVQTGIHHKIESASKKSRREVIFSMYGTLDDFQKHNPIQVSDDGDFKFTSGVSERSNESGSFKQILNEDTLTKYNDRTVSLKYIEVEGIINNAPIPVGFAISGVESGPDFKIQHTTYDPIFQKCSKGFSSAFSPKPSITISDRTSKNPKIEFEYTKPSNQLFDHVNNDHSKASPVQLKQHAYCDAFGISSGTAHCNDLDNNNQSDSKSRTKGATAFTAHHMGLSVGDDPNMMVDSIIHSYTNSRGEHVILVPRGSPLHLAFCNGHVENVLRRSESTLLSVLSQSESSSPTGSTQTKWNPEKMIKTAIKQAKQQKNQQKSQNSSKKALILDSSAKDLSSPMNHTEYDAESLHSFFEALTTVDALKHEGRVEKIKEWKNLINEGTLPLSKLVEHPIWAGSVDSQKIGRHYDSVSIVELSNNPIQLYLLTLFKFVGSKFHLRNFTGCLIRLDSPDDWTAKGRLTDQQYESIKDKTFSIEVKVCINMHVQKPLSIDASKRVRHDDSEESSSFEDETKSSSSDEYTSGSDSD